MIISHSRRFTFVHIHKAGGTSMERALDPHLAWNDLILGGSPLGEKLQDPFSERFGLNKHSQACEIERVCGSQYLDEYYLFALVRHPVARVCSIYNFVATMLDRWARRQDIPLSEVAARVTPKAAKKTPSLKWPSSRIFLRTRNLSEFIRDEAIDSVPGFRTQVSSLRRENGVIAGETFRLEDYPNWAETLGGRLGLEFRLPHENRSGLKLTSPESLTPEDLASIEARFEADYSTFGYDRMGPPGPQS